MRRAFITAKLLRLPLFFEFIFQPPKTLLKTDDVLLLPKNFLIEAHNGFVLYGREGFELDYSFVHGAEYSRFSKNGQRFWVVLH